MTRTLLTGGRLFDGTGAALGDADVVVEDGRIAEVGTGLDGDESVDLAGKTVLPGCSTPTCTSTSAAPTC